MDIDFAKFSASQLSELSTSISKEKARRIALKPDENLEKSIKKTYLNNYCRNRGRKGQNHSWDSYDLSGWSFERFRDFMMETYSEKKLKKPQYIDYITPFEKLKSEKEKEWRLKNGYTSPGGFCVNCDRYYIEEKCGRC